MTTLPGAERFSTSAQRVVDYLNRVTPIRDWSVARVAGGEQVHIHVHRDEVVEVGMRLDWPTTFCSRMTAGAPHVSADTLADPAYADLDLSQTLRSYAGVPISDDDGSMFGVICGAGRQPLESAEQVDVGLLRLLSDLLADQLATARLVDQGQRRLHIGAALDQLDPLTGLLNRRGWDRLVADAQQRVDAFGDVVSVAVIDLDHLKRVNDEQGHQAGDEHLRHAAEVLRNLESLGDRTARYGGDEFTVLANNVPAAEMNAYFLRIRDALDEAGVPGSVGWAIARPGEPLSTAFATADQRMYAMKRERQSALVDLPVR